MWKTALLLTATCNILQLLRLQKTCWFWVLWKCTYSSSNTNSECQFARPEDRDLKFTWSFNHLLFTISILDLLPPLGRGVIWLLRRKKRLLWKKQISVIHSTPRKDSRVHFMHLAQNLHRMMKSMPWFRSGSTARGRCSRSRYQIFHEGLTCLLVRQAVNVWERTKCLESHIDLSLWLCVSPHNAPTLNILF